MRRLPLFAAMAALAAACGRSNLGLDDAEGIGGGGASASSSSGGPCFTPADCDDADKCTTDARVSCGGDDCNSLIDCGGMNAAVIDIPSSERNRPYA